ncbi:MAG: hypothetical protein KAI40_06210 [Desulfobacterales bacterium]|nr:hypothetical protein [Desulfobacterales bacterium]
MGLSLVHGLITKMGGSIQVFSQLGKGSEFNVYFPVLQGIPKADKIKIKKSLQRGSEKIREVLDE